MVRAISFIYHIWYYIMGFVTIVALLPFLLVAAQPWVPYRYFFGLGRVWGVLYLLSLGIVPWPKRNRHELPEGPFVLAPNHSSDLDIPMTFVFSPRPVVFMGKAELLKLPIFGFFFRKTSIPVDRSTYSGRKKAMEMADQAVKAGSSVCIYPEGGIPPHTHLLRSFKAGAFKLALDNDVPVVPSVIYDMKRRFGDWNRPCSPGICRTEVLAPLRPKMDCEDPVGELSDRTYMAIGTRLKAHGYTGKEALPLPSRN